MEQSSNGNSYISMSNNQHKYLSKCGSKPCTISLSMDVNPQIWPMGIDPSPIGNSINFQKRDKHLETHASNLISTDDVSARIVTAHQQFESEIWIRHLGVLGGLRHAGHRLTDVGKGDQRLSLSTALLVPFLNEANCLQQASSAMLLIDTSGSSDIFGSHIFSIAAASATSLWIKNALHALFEACMPSKLKTFVHTWAPRSKVGFTSSYRLKLVSFQETVKLKITYASRAHRIHKRGREPRTSNKYALRGSRDCCATICCIL